MDQCSYLSRKRLFFKKMNVTRDITTLVKLDFKKQPLLNYDRNYSLEKKKRNIIF